MSKYYTLIGSRSTPPEVFDKLVQIAKYLKQLGYIVRSGGADGADTAAEVGAGYENLNIYLPWERFNGRSSSARGYIDASKLKTYHEAQVIAENTHPAWERCSRGAKGLHTRNVYQILGSKLDEPSEFVVCWAEPVGRSGQVKGGTATAVKLAISHNIPVFNLYFEDDLVNLRQFVKEKLNEKRK